MRAERDENVGRKPFTASEAVALGRDLEKLLGGQAKGRQRRAGIGNLRNVSGGNFPPLSDAGEANGQKGKTRDQDGQVVGLSGRSYTKARAVVGAAEAELKAFGDLVELMDATGKIERASRAAPGLLARQRESQHNGEGQHKAQSGGTGGQDADAARIVRLKLLAKVRALANEAETKGARQMASQLRAVWNTYCKCGKLTGGSCLKSCWAPLRAARQVGRPARGSERDAGAAMRARARLAEEKVTAWQAPQQSFCFPRRVSLLEDDGAWRGGLRPHRFRRWRWWRRWTR